MSNFFYIFLLIFFSGSLFLLSILNRNNIENLSSKYNPIQKIHNEYVPPIGGLVIFLSFNIYLFLFYRQSILLEIFILIPSILIFIVSFKEDLHSNVSPLIRFFTIFFASIVFTYFFYEQLPNIDINFINNFFESFPFIEILFYSLCLTALSNGFNMIDGMNGLAGLTAISIVIGLITLLFITNQLMLLGNELSSLLILILVFLFFNFPFGKIFLGDSGAYWLGWILGVIILIIYSNDDLNTWGAALLVFYPTTEVIFSTIRKSISNKNPFKPDLNHLHLKLYFTLKGPISRSKRFNSFTTLTLMPLWFTPCTMILWTQFYSHLTILGLFFMIVVYLYFFYLIPNDKYHNNSV